MFFYHRFGLSCPQDGAFAFHSGQIVIFESLVTFTDNVMGVSEKKGNWLFATLLFEGYFEVFHSLDASIRA